MGACNSSPEEQRIVRTTRFKKWLRSGKEVPLKLLIRRNAGEMAGQWQVAKIKESPTVPTVEDVQTGSASDDDAEYQLDTISGAKDPAPAQTNDSADKYKVREESKKKGQVAFLNVLYEAEQAIISEDVNTLTKDRVRFIEDFVAGDSVEANYQSRGYWYKAHVAGPSPYSAVTLGKRGSYFLSQGDMADLDKRKRGMDHSKLELLRVDHMLGKPDIKQYELGEEVVDLIYEDGIRSVKTDIFRRARVNGVIEIAVPVKRVRLAKLAHT